MESFDLELRTRVVFGPGSLNRLGEVARSLGFTRSPIVSDNGLLSTGVAERAKALLADAGIESWSFHEFDPNPDMQMVEDGRLYAAPLHIDSIVALGGGPLRLELISRSRALPL